MIKFFISVNNSLYAIVQQLVITRDPQDIIIHTVTNIEHKDIKPIRESYCIYIIPVEVIEAKVVRVMNYVCLLPNLWEKR